MYALTDSPFPDGSAGPFRRQKSVCGSMCIVVIAMGRVSTGSPHGFNEGLHFFQPRYAQPLFGGGLAPSGVSLYARTTLHSRFALPLPLCYTTAPCGFLSARYAVFKRFAPRSGGTHCCFVFFNFQGARSQPHRCSVPPGRFRRLTTEGIIAQTDFPCLPKKIGKIKIIFTQKNRFLRERL